MTGPSHDEVPRGGQICQEADNSTARTLLCWLAPGHEGAHWDRVDKAHWTTRPLKVEACQHETAARR